jgi:hypothetical protein
MVVLYNKKLQTFDPVNSGQINESLLGNPLLAWCTDIVEVVMQQSINEAKIQMREIREATKELFGLVTDFSIAGYSAIMTPFSFHEQKVIIHLCEQWYQIQLQEILPPEKELREFAETKKAIVNDLIHTDDIEVHMDAIPVQEPIKEEENKNLAKDKPYLQEIIAIEGNRNIDLAFVQALRLVPLSSPESKTITTPEAKYVALRKTAWKTGIPCEFFNDLLLIHVREIVKVKQTAVSQFHTVLHEEFLQILNVFGKLCPTSFKEFTQLPLPMFFEDPGIMNDLITNPTHVSLPFNHSSRSSSLENVQTFDSFAFSPGQTGKEKPQQDRKAKTKLSPEITFQELWDRTFFAYDSTFSLLDPHIISKLEAENLQLAMHLTQVTYHDNTRT